MNHISMVEANLPPGFRFHPRDEELVCDYLIYKITHGQPLLMIEVDLNKCEPWDIPDTARVGGNEWYFYSQRDRKYATGLRTNRATAAGYWKATGKDRPVYSKNTLVGMRKTLVFYEGRAPKGRKTEWVMHEFRLEGTLATSTISFIKEDWVLCRVFCKNKEVAARASMGSCYDDSSSSPLPPLMDSYIRFDQTQPNLDEYEQVPCFSIFSENQTNPIFTDVTHVGPPITHGDIPMTSCLDPISSDKQVIKVALNQVTKMNSNLHIKGSSSLVEASPESYLSEVGVPQHIETFLM